MSESENQKKHRKQAKQVIPPKLRAAMSETEGSDYTQYALVDAKAKQRRKSNAKKHNTNYDSAAHSDGPNVRQNHHPQKTHATPIKSQAYAGPTFHQSPAASALPLPSFYSKSLPSNDITKTVIEDERPATQMGEVQGATSPPAEPKRESTPLDFLFDAARKAQMTPGSESPQFKFLAPAIGKSPSQSPAPREGDSMFPFEMGSDETKTASGNASSSTPFKDKLEAIRPGNTPSPAGKHLGEDERKAKTAALKDFLMSSAKNTEIADNPFNARPAPQYQQPWPYQRNSNPGTPQYHNAQSNQQYFPQYQYGPFGPASPNNRAPGSNLRNIYAPEFGPNQMAASSDRESSQARRSTARDQTPIKQPFQGYHTPPVDASPEQKMN